MHRVTVKIERQLAAFRPSRTSTPEEKYSSEVFVSIQAPATIDALDKAIRLLTSERDALMKTVAVPVKGEWPGNNKPDPEIDEDEDEDED